MDDITQQINNVCRLCLCEDENLVSIFEDSSTLPQKIVLCVNVEVQITDRMSTMICKPCLGKVDEWYDFKKCCEDVQIKLRQWANSLGGDRLILGITIKEEIIDTDDIDMLVDTSMCIKSEPPESLSPHLSDDEDRVNFEYGEMPTLVAAVNIEPHTDDLLIPTLECPAAVHGLNAPSFLNHRKPIKRNEIEHSFKSNHEKLDSICRVCEKSFSSYHNRIRHEKTVHALAKELSITAVRSLQDEDPLLEYLPEHCEDNNSETSNVTIEQFAASLQLVQTTQMTLPKAEISEKEFVRFNRKVANQVERQICDCCNTPYTSKGLMAHLRKSMNIPNFSCFWCCISFPNRSQYMQHASKKYCKQRARLVQSGDYPFKAYQHYQCSACKVLFVHKLFVLTHITNIHKGREFPMTCPICRGVYDTKNDYKEHTQSSTCFIKLYCSICASVFDNQTEFDNHSQIHDFEPVQDPLAVTVKEDRPESEIEEIEIDSNKPFYCHICNKIYVSYRGVLMHMTESHKHYKLKRCKLCRKRFIFKTDLQVHMISEHDKKISSNNFSCVQCGAQFPTLEKWCEHQQSHTDSVHQCEDCSKVFISDEELKDHKSTAHSNIKLKLYRCSDSNSYKTVSSFEDTEDETTKIDDRIFKCDQCQLAYRIRSSLVKHKKLKHGHRTVTRGRPPKLKNKFSCGFCKKKFTNNVSLVLHKRHVHHRNNGQIIENDDTDDSKSEYPHSCDVCFKSFPTVKALSIHAKTHATSPAKMIENANTATDISPSIKTSVKTSTVKSAAIKASPLKAVPINMDAPINMPAPNNEEDIIEPVEERTCDICEDEFRTIAEYQKHARTHIIRKRKIAKRCVICRNKYVRLDNHMRVTHNMIIVPKKSLKKKSLPKKSLPKKSLPKKSVPKNPTQLTCQHCFATFSGPSLLTRHLKKHITNPGSRNTVYKCEFCPKVCVTAPGLDAHTKRVHRCDEETTGYKCEFCLKVCLTKVGLELHTTRIHRQATDDDKLIIKKEVVDNEADNEVVIEKIVEVKKEPGLPVSYDCKHCDKTFSRPGVWRTHMFKDHPTMKMRRFTCNQCNKIFPSEVSLSRHIKLYRNSKTHIKPKIIKKQNTLSQIKQHTYVPQIKKSQNSVLEPTKLQADILKCILCKKSFANEQILKRHMAWHNRRNGVTIPCTICNEPFKTMDALNLHHRTSHREEKCKYCSRPFTKQIALKHHIATKHARKLKLDSDALITKTKNTLTKVKKNVSSDNVTAKPVLPERLYSCTACNMTFLNAVKLRLHVTKTHNMALSE